MRSELKALGNNRRYTFIATFERYGSRKIQFSCYPMTTMLFRNIICKANGKQVADHIWFNCGKNFTMIGDFTKGDMIQFDARVDDYEKGYKGMRAMELGYEDIEKDWKLCRPTNIKKIQRQDVLL